LSVPLDHLAANIDPGYEGLEGCQGHRAARYLQARHWNVWSSSGASNPGKHDHLPGHDDGVAVDDLGRAGQPLCAG
jgi:hypothetical protein